MRSIASLQPLHHVSGLPNLDQLEIGSLGDWQGIVEAPAIQAFGNSERFKRLQYLSLPRPRITRLVQIDMGRGRPDPRPEYNAALQELADKPSRLAHFWVQSEFEDAEELTSEVIRKNRAALADPRCLIVLRGLSER